MANRIAVFGSTGSVGRNALRVIEALGPDYEIAALTANTNVSLLAEQVKRCKPKFAAVTDSGAVSEFLERIGDTDVEVLTGPEGMVELASDAEIDTVIFAVVGSAGLPAVLAAAEKGKRLAIANKESLVIAGKLLTETARRTGAVILPVDSEHSAIFQAMQAGRRDEVRRIILTASGGPFRGFSSDEIKNVTLEQALAHPVWDMGPKITIDSATMMNKALEIIEARWLFDMPAKKIDVLIHPESIVHSLVEFVDGSVIAQLGRADMCLPIQYALTYPRRVEATTERLELEQIRSLSFEQPDFKTFRALSLGFEVAEKGGTAAAVFNAANEAAVQQFLDGKIGFADIVELIEYCLDWCEQKTDASLEQLLEADIWARRQVQLKTDGAAKNIKT